jgi:hypothetical protein
VVEVLLTDYIVLIDCTGGRPPWLCACVCRGGLKLGVGGKPLEHVAMGLLTPPPPSWPKTAARPQTPSRCLLPSDASSCAYCILSRVKFFELLYGLDQQNNRQEGRCADALKYNEDLRFAERVRSC